MIAAASLLLAAAAGAGDAEALRETVRAIAARVETLRGERFGRPPVAVRVPDAIREASAEIRALSVVTRERLAARGRAFSDLGLGDGKTPERLYRLLAGDLEGIGLDPQTNRLLVAPDRLTVADFDALTGEGERATVLMQTGVRVDEPVIAHLLTHVRQLERHGRDALATTTDETLARAAWAEGEANLVALRLLFGGMGIDDVVLEGTLDPATVFDGALLAPALRAGASDAAGLLVRFVYDEGFHRAAEAVRQGGWAAFAERSARPTTRALLHPETGAGAVASIEPPEAPFAGLRRVDDDVLGEQVVFTLVSLVTGKDNLALMAADGWAGDGLFRYEPAPPGDPEAGATIWVTRWQRPEDAEEFDYALRRAIEARHPGRPPIVGEDGALLLVAGARTWRVAREAATVRLRIAARALDDPAPSERDISRPR